MIPVRPGCPAPASKSWTYRQADHPRHPHGRVQHRHRPLARAIRVHTGYAREPRSPRLARQALTGSGDIDPGDGVLTVCLDQLPTQRATTAIAELCEHLTATETRYPGTDLVLRYEVRTRP